VAIDLHRRVAVLDLDPDLGQGLSTEHFALARTRAIARAATAPCGGWEPPAADAAGQLGLLVLDGLLTRNISLWGRVSMELLGAEDLLRPWDDDVDLGLSSVPKAVTWTVHEPLRMAVLDRGFAERVSPWPEIGAALIGRAVRRSRWLDGHLAILENPSVEARALLFLWHLADRWGRVSADGVHLPLRVTHHTLGRLVRAQRPSITRAVNDLARRGALSRSTDGTWILHGEPPSAQDAAERSYTSV
jgi:CRP/FNR family transcriptional regulator, cyclic AMP receptor protein